MEPATKETLIATAVTTIVGALLTRILNGILPDSLQLDIAQCAASIAIGAAIGFIAGSARARKREKGSADEKMAELQAEHAAELQVLDERISLPYEVWERHRDGYFLQVEGQCMSRVYPEGSYILIDPARRPANGSIAVVSIDGADYVMRRLYRGANVLVLSPDSFDDCYTDIVVDDPAAHTVEFVGTVVWFQPSAELE